MGYIFGGAPLPRAVKEPLRGPQQVAKLQDLREDGRTLHIA